MGKPVDPNEGTVDLSPAQNAEGSGDPRPAQTAISDPKQTVPRGQAAAEPTPAEVANTQHPQGAGRAHIEKTLEYPAAPATPHSETLELPGSDPAAGSGDPRRAHVAAGAAPKRGSTTQNVPKVPGYQILSELGRGGMGVVYRARQIKLNRIVALKMVLSGAHASKEQLNRFFTEAEAVASLQHPNIVQIYEVSEYEGLPFFSIEYVDGGMLADKINGMPRPPREAAATVSLLADAMTTAHERGVVHRDLKPTNILLTSDGQPKITDFGLAKKLEDDSSQTKTGTLLGSPSYMSPEQARGDTHQIGPLSDLYSLGAILYELLTGRPPFVGPTVLETVMMVRNHEPVAPTRLQLKCPRDLETICLKCLQKETSRRYANCQNLADDLHHYLAGEPITARPVGWIEHSWRWVKRNPKIAALAACVAVLLMAVAMSLATVTIRRSREREALAKTREIAGERLEQATSRAAAGNYQQSQDILQWSDPLLSNDELADVRSNLDTLKAQVNLYAEFRQLLDSARFNCRFGSRQEKERGRDDSRRLLALYDEIEKKSGRGLSGLPPLNEEQQQLFKEDVFEAFLTAANVERELAAGENESSRSNAATKALGWLNRADQLLPGTRTLPAQRALCHAELGDTNAAKADRDLANSIPPTSAVDHFWLGYANHRQGDKALEEQDEKTAADYYHLEIGEYAAFLQQRPESFWGYFNWANAHVQLGGRDNLHDALIGYTACTRLRPDFPWPYNNRGTAHLRLGQAELASQDFSAALKRNQNYPEAYVNRGAANVALKKLDPAVADFSKAIALNPDATDALAARAEIYRGRKQYTLAIQDDTRLLALTENKYPLLEKRAAAYRAVNRISEAILDYSEMLKLNPGNLDARLTRAELFLSQENYAAARDDFSAILEQKPNVAKILRARAILNWQNLKDFDAALSDFEHLAGLAPSDAEPRFCIGAILMGRKQFAEALDSFEQSLALRPDYPDAIWAKAEILQRTGKCEEALKILDDFVARVPSGPPETFNVRAGVCQALGKLDEAAADCNRMIAAKPKEPEAYVCLARIYEKLGQSEKAVACLDKLVAAAPDSKWAFVRRAEFRRDRGEFDGADADCDRAARLAPTWPIPALVRAGITAARGNPAAAVSQAKSLLDKSSKNDGHILYAAACVWSLAAHTTKDDSESNRLAETAADFLTRTLDRGFHDLIYPEQNRIAEDPALARIRDLERVRDLLTNHGLSAAKK